MTYIAQFKKRGCRNWVDFGEYPKRQDAMSVVGNIFRNAFRVRVLEIPPIPKDIASAFVWSPKVIFEGVFK